jgi:hypothetical protein
MRRRLALFVPALALAAAGSLPLAAALSGSAGASSIRNTGGSTAGQAGMGSNQTESSADTHASHDQDKGEHLDLTCFDRDRPINQQSTAPATAAPATAAPTTAATGSTAATAATGSTAAATAQPMIECDWHPATRKDFGGYKLERTSDPLTAKSMASGSSTTSAASTTASKPAPEAGPKSATNPTLMTVLQSSTRSTSMELDTSVSFNVEYTYQLQVLDSHGNVAVRSEPQTVIDRSPATDVARKDEAARDESARDEAARDESARDESARDEASRDCQAGQPASQEDGSSAQTNRQGDGDKELCDQQSQTSGARSGTGSGNAQAADSRTAVKR